MEEEREKRSKTLAFSERGCVPSGSVEEHCALYEVCRAMECSDRIEAPSARNSALESDRPRSNDK